MPEVVSFAAPYDVALVPCDAAAAGARLGAGAHVVLRHLRRHGAHRLPRLEPLPDAHLGRRPPAVRRRRRRPSPTRSQGWGYSEVGEVVEVADDVDGARPSATWCTASGATAARPCVPAAAVARPDLDRGRTPLSGTFARVGLDRPQRRAGRRGPARRPGRGLRAGRDRPAGHPARRPRRGRGDRRRRACPAPRRGAGDGGAPRSSRPTRRRRRRGRDPGLVGRRRRLRDRAQRQRPRPCTRRSAPSSSTAPWWPPASTRAAPRTCASARSSTTTGSASWPARSPAPRSRSARDGTSPGWCAPSWTRCGAARVDVRSLVTDVVDAADVAAVFERLDRGDPEILQAVLRFPAAPEAP